MTYRAELKQRTRDSRGFTLLEVVLSLTVMALIITVAYAGFSIAVDTWHRGLRKVDDLDRRFAAERLFERQITQADPLSFRGNSREVEFTTAYSLTNGPGDPVRVKYGIDLNANGAFLYSETPIGLYDASQTAAAVTQNLPGFAVDGFRYLYTMPNKDREWSDQTKQETVNESKKENVLAVRVAIAGDVLTIPVESIQ